MFDTGGDGWGSATYALFSSTSLAESGEGALVTSGTLAAGAEGSDWLCLADGCYELIVGGGSADSEIGFEFIDEVRRAVLPNRCIRLCAPIGRERLNKKEGSCA